MSVTGPHVDVANELAALVSPDLGAVGTNIFAGRVKTKGIDVDVVVPDDNLWFCVLRPGREPQQFIGTVTNSILYSRVQVIHRNTSEDDGLVKARAGLGVFVDKTMSGYISVDLQQSEPEPLPPVNGTLLEWSFNLILSHQEA